MSVSLDEDDVAYKTIVDGLKGLLGVQLETIDPARYVAQLRQESDRGAIILGATMIDDALADALRSKMPALNSDERTRMFSYDGQAGSFSNRIKLAYALGIIQRPLRRQIEVIKELRNTAAHTHEALTFEMLQVKRAVAYLFTLNEGEDMTTWNAKDVRDMYLMVVGVIADVIIGADPSEYAPNLARMVKTKNEPPKPS